MFPVPREEINYSFGSFETLTATHFFASKTASKDLRTYLKPLRKTFENAPYFIEIPSKLNRTDSSDDHSPADRILVSSDLTVILHQITVKTYLGHRIESCFVTVFLVSSIEFL